MEKDELRKEINSYISTEDFQKNDEVRKTKLNSRITQKRLQKHLETIKQKNKQLAKKQQIEKIIENQVILDNQKTLTRDEFTKRYKYSISWQDQKKGRLNDPLPFRQAGERCNIFYDVDEVEKWFERNNIAY